MRIINLRRRMAGTGAKSREKGQALIVVLALLLMASIIITSSLGFIGTSFNTNKTYKASTMSLYAAEAGIQDGVWNVLNLAAADLGTKVTPVSPSSTTYSDYDYNSYGWSYNMSQANGQQVNGYDVMVNIRNTWVPLIDFNSPTWVPSVSSPLPPDGTITAPTINEANAIVNDTGLVITGHVSSVPVYSISVAYNGSPLSVMSVGLWLPQGYIYNNGSSNIHDASGNWLYSNEQVLDCAGNEAVIWSFDSQTFSSLQSSMGQSGGTLEITVQYTTASSKMPDALAWITVTPNALDFNHAFTWNADVKLFDLISTAGGTEIEAFTPKSETRSLGNALPGDYFAIGNSLLTMNGLDPRGVRTVVLSSSDAAITSSDIPSDATVQGAFLYWSGWIDSSSRPLGPDWGGKVNFSINGNHVSYNPQGRPNRGNQALSSSRNQIRTMNITGAGDYSYSCYKDVTELVRWELQQEGLPVNGVANYTVGPESGCPLAVFPSYGQTGDEWAYAGWSLIIVYSSPGTLGHQLYLYDDFVYADGNHGYAGNGADIDPTGNTAGPGGYVSGFIVPPQVGNDTMAAKFTAFVGEGDWRYNGDFLAFNAPPAYWSDPWSIPANSPYRLWDNIDLPIYSNTQTNPDNVWNAYSQAGLADGVDIKTFYVPWTSGLLHAGDTAARIDMPTQTDSWNLVYMIFSFRSSVSNGDAISYMIRKIPLP